MAKYLDCPCIEQGLHLELEACVRHPPTQKNKWEYLHEPQRKFQKSNMHTKKDHHIQKRIRFYLTRASARGSLNPTSLLCRPTQKIFPIHQSISTRIKSKYYTHRHARGKKSGWRKMGVAFRKMLKHFTDMFRG
jgi:hypothetical protein